MARGYTKDRDAAKVFDKMFSYWVGPRGVEPKLKLKIGALRFTGNGCHSLYDCRAGYTVLLRRAHFALERLPLLVVLLATAAITALPLYAPVISDFVV